MLVKTYCDVRNPNSPISELISAWTDYKCKLFFEVDHCVVLFTTDVRLESRL